MILISNSYWYVNMKVIKIETDNTTSILLIML